ncbi:MAG: diguanylate cyclase [Dechloromonas sp.]|uniref:Diguanylate cyclase n=1 Tax=Candidatus Dechloromonas phosphorivorans TaxID=2899244 RepID=A0A935K1L2_9RHOO|nr:diguanylate cyclase [Candidatus Dechloromonas phosphorivorans]
MSAPIEQAQQSAKAPGLLALSTSTASRTSTTRLGHRAGDQLLQKAALRLGANLFINCQLFRQGGDEFIVLMTSTPFIHSPDCRRPAPRTHCPAFHQPECRLPHQRQHWHQPSS